MLIALIQPSRVHHVTVLSVTDFSEIYPAFYLKYNFYPEVGNSKVMRNFTVLFTIGNNI
jgi:hypothetical protein